MAQAKKKMPSPAHRHETRAPHDPRPVDVLPAPSPVGDAWTWRDAAGRPMNPAGARLAEAPPAGDDVVLQEVLRGVGMLTEPGSLQAVGRAVSAALARPRVSAPAAPGHLV